MQTPGDDDETNVPIQLPTDEAEALFEEPTVATRPRRRFIPQTMVGGFGQGILIGIIAGVVLPSLRFGQTEFIEVPWLAPLMGNPDFLGVPTYEVVGFVIAAVAFVFYGLMIDAHLAAALTFGYSLSLPTVLLTRAPENHDLVLTYVGYLILFNILAALLIFSAPTLKRFRRVVTTPRM